MFLLNVHRTIDLNFFQYSLQTASDGDQEVFVQLHQVLISHTLS